MLLKELDQGTSDQMDNSFADRLRSQLEAKLGAEMEEEFEGRIAQARKGMGTEVAGAGHAVARVDLLTPIE
jgi:hypothetical protein